jgi:hypothetical protein
MKSNTKIGCGGHRTFQADGFDEVRAALGDVTGSHNSDSSVRASGGLPRGKGGNLFADRYRGVSGVEENEKLLAQAVAAGAGCRCSEERRIFWGVS